MVGRYRFPSHFVDAREEIGEGLRNRCYICLFLIAFVPKIIESSGLGDFNGDLSVARMAFLVLTGYKNALRGRL